MVVRVKMSDDKHDITMITDIVESGYTQQESTSIASCHMWRLVNDGGQSEDERW